MLLEHGKQILALYPGCRISFGLIDGGEELNIIDGDGQFLMLNLAVQ
jgi:hypothetical protein